MRPYLAALVLVFMALTLTAAPSKQKQCKNSCDITYHFCMQRNFTKVGRKQCSAQRASCKKSCPAMQ